MDTTVLLTFGACLLGIFIISKILLFPIKKIIKLLFNSIIGGIIIYIINMVGANIGIHIGLNFITALVVGILGIPGAILLIILSFF